MEPKDRNLLREALDELRSIRVLLERAEEMRSQLLGDASAQLDSSLAEFDGGDLEPRLDEIREETERYRQEELAFREDIMLELKCQSQILRRIADGESSAGPAAE